MTRRILPFARLAAVAALAAAPTAAPAALAAAPTAAPAALAATAGPAAAQSAAAPPTVAADVLARGVARGELLSAADFAAADIGAAQARGAVPAAAAAGREARRNLGAGQVVRASDLIAPQLVRRGEAVRIAVRDGALAIVGGGRALSGGAAGETVRVVADTGRTLDGTVDGAGSVRVGLAGH